jgi:hypothetical protein
VKLNQPAHVAKLSDPSTTLSLFSLLLLTLLCVGDARASSATTRALSIAELTTRSDVIVLGTVSFIASDWNLNRTAIETRIDLKVEETLKGTVEHAKVSLYQLGGVVGDSASSLGEAAAFVEGERVAVFLSKNNRERLQVVGFFQGKFSVERRPEGLMAVRRVPGVSKPVDEFPLDNFKLQVQEAIT